MARKSRQKFYYKVVTDNGDDEYTSAMVGKRSLKDLEPTVYSVGKKTRRYKGCGPMAVFEELEKAAWFMLNEQWLFNEDGLRKTYNNLRLFKCVARRNLRVMTTYAERAWMWVGNKTIGFCPPGGTVLVDEVTLLEEIVDAAEEE